MAQRQTRLERFEEACANVAHGERNRYLLKIAKLGRVAGIESGELSRLIHARLDGTDPLTEREVDQAIRKVEQEIPLGGDIPEGATLTPSDRQQLASKIPPAPPPRKDPTIGERSFFERMAAAGRAWVEDHPLYGGKRSSALYALSPVQFDPLDWRGQAAMMIDRLAADWLGFTYVGKQYDDRIVHQAETLEEGIRSGRVEIPPQIIANQLSGDREWKISKKHPEGYWSYATTKTILHYRHAVVEFDGFIELLPDGKEKPHKLPLETQADFWIGCITSGTLAPVALVYSGSKSIHGIVRLLELRDREELAKLYPAGGTFLEHYERIGATLPKDRARTPAERLWGAQWLDLERLLGSAENMLYHLDGACKDATRQTRLAGHLRADTHRRQALLYLTDAPLRDLPRLDDPEPVEA